jgi:hypothetical protein
MEYYFKATAGNEYGPLGQTQIRDWLEQGRMDGNSLVRPADSDDWSPLSDHPELSGLLAPQSAATPAPPHVASASQLPPHQGALILTFGIVSIVCCFPFGIAAWIMGNKDLQKIDAGLMDPTGRGLTNAGKICGIVGTIIGIIGCGAQLLFIALGAASEM